MIDHQASTPLYHQLKEFIYAQIRDGKLAAGAAIPSERELCGMFGVSRTTVRQAINEAVGEGILEKRHGKGTFVLPKKIAQGLKRITSFERTLTERGFVPSTKVEGFGEIRFDAEISRFLNISVNDKIMKLNLLGFADNEPVVYYVSYFPFRLGNFMVQRALEKERSGVSFSSYDLYFDGCEVQPAVARQTFEASVADEATRRLLRIKRGVPVFLVTSLVTAADGDVLEYRKAIYRGDRYKFEMVREM